MLKRDGTYLRVRGGADGTDKDFSARAGEFSTQLAIGSNAGVPVGISASRMVVIDGAFGATGANSAALLYLHARVDAPAGQNAAGLDVDPTLGEAGSSTHSVMAGVRIRAFNILNGAALTDQAVGLYIEGVPTGSGVSPAESYAMRVLAGPSRFDGPVRLGVYANAHNALGLTVNQGAGDDEILSLKSSDVAHGLTSVTETDTYAYLTKYSATHGGLFLDALSESNDGVALRLRAVTVATDDTSKSTGSNAKILLDGATDSGTSVRAISDSVGANLLAIRNHTTTRFIFDSDGNSYQDVGTAWTNFDEHDDVALLSLLAAHVTRRNDPLREAFGTWLAQNRAPLERLKLVTFNDDGHHFLNTSRLLMLLTGAVRQLAGRLSEHDRRILAMEA